MFSLLKAHLPHHIAPGVCVQAPWAGEDQVHLDPDPGGVPKNIRHLGPFSRWQLGSYGSAGPSDS